MGNNRSIAKTSNEASADSGCNRLARVLAHGVVSPLLRMTKPRDFLLALSQNRQRIAFHRHS